MNDATAVAYREALRKLQRTAPSAAAAVSAHVMQLEHHIFDTRAEQQRLEARIAEAAASQSESIEPTNFVVVRDDGLPITTTSTPEIIEAGMDLVGQLTADGTVDIGQLIRENAVRYGPVAGPIESVALHFLVEQIRPFLTLFRAAHDG